MSGDIIASPVDPLLIKGWLTARSLARDLPPPIEDHGGWRVDTNLATETRRFVFANVVEQIRYLGESIVDPLVFLKLCGPATVLGAMLPARWQVQPSGYLMTCEGQMNLPTHFGPGYRIEMSRAGALTAVRIVTNDGALAASGFAAEAEGLFVYDRIVTEPAHRRLGLGRAVMATLGGERRHASSEQVLVATEDGRALYASLGWIARSPYASAVIPSA